MLLGAGRFPSPLSSGWPCGKMLMTGPTTGATYSPPSPPATGVVASAVVPMCCAARFMTSS